MAFSLSFLSRYQSTIVAIAAITAGCTIIYVQRADTLPSSSPTSPQPGLRRSNAQRRHSRLHGRRSDQLSSETDRPSEGNHEMDGHPGETGDADVRNSAPEERVREENLTTEGEIMNEDSEDEKKTADEKRAEDEKKARIDEQNNRLNLLYRIAEEQSIREGYIHRGIECNSCHQLPIRGIRFRCVNCCDYDLCEQCEANEQHIKTHVFLKIKVPIPFLGSPRQTPLPVFYPGKPIVTQDLSFSEVVQHAKENDLTHSEVKAVRDQFLCLASPLVDRSSVEVFAITRQAFDRCLIPSGTVRSAATDLLYGRMFDFYDTNRDGLISFGEFISGLACLTKRSRADEKLQRIFTGYDMDQDGWVRRRDFRRIFKAYYALNRELAKDMVAAWGKDPDENFLMGSQPISSAFQNGGVMTTRTEAGYGKERDEHGDYIIPSGEGLVRDAEDEWVPEADRVGREVIYKITEQAMDELLDLLFLNRECEGEDGGISFDEFREIMNGSEELGFVKSWVDLATF